MSQPASQPGDRGRRGTTWFAVRISLFGIALTALWTPLNSLVLPDLVSEVGPEGARGSFLGLLTFVGIGLAVFVQPIAGAISDAAKLPDRRRPFIVAAAVAMCVLCLPLPWLPTISLLLLCYVALQLASNVAQAAFQALVPDLVPESERDVASGVKTGFDVLGNFVGLAGAGAIVLLGGGNELVVVFLAVVIGVGGWAAWALVPPVPPAEGEHLENPVKLVRKAFAPAFRGPVRFRWAVLMRFVFLLGLYPVQRFLLYYLEDKFDIEDPMGKASIGVLAAILVGALGALAAGWLADSVGRGRVLRASIWISAIGLAGVAFSPHLLLLGAAGVVLALGAGAFQAANWALLSDLIPEGQGARYFGVANIATAGASALAGALGPLVDLANNYIPGATYEITYGVCSLIVLATLWPVARLGRGADQPPADQEPERVALASRR